MVLSQSYCIHELVTSQVHCILMRLMVGRVKSRLSVLHSIIMVNLFNCYGVLTGGHHFNDFAKSHCNLMHETGYSRPFNPAHTPYPTQPYF